LCEYDHQQRSFRFAVFFAPHLALRLIKLLHKLFNCWSMEEAMSGCRIVKVPFHKSLRVRLWRGNEDGKIKLWERSVTKGEYGRVMGEGRVLVQTLLDTNEERHCA
jgi:hypothetical protein